MWSAHSNACSSAASWYARGSCTRSLCSRAHTPKLQAANAEQTPAGQYGSTLEVLLLINTVRVSFLQLSLVWTCVCASR